MNYKIFLLEDLINDKDQVISVFEKESSIYLNDGIHFSIEHLPGMGEVKKHEDGDHCFYQENIIEIINKKINEVEMTEGDKAGLLLDVILTEHEHEESIRSYYPKSDLAKRIYTEFNDRVAVYFITSIMYFEVRSEMIMGENMSDKFISKKALLEYKYKNNIKDMFDYYTSFKPTQQVKTGNEIH